MLLALFLLAGCGEEEQAGKTPPAPSRPEVGVVTLHPQSVAVTAELPGRTGASLIAEVRPQVAGIIRERLFREGTEIKAGDALYQIEPASYQAALDAAVASQQRAEAALPAAQAKVDRIQTLFKQRVVSQQELDDALASLKQVQADVAAAVAAVESARINLNFTRITAPISGRIGQSSLTQGALVTADQETALTVIRALDPINVDVTESSTRLLDIRQEIAEGRVKITGPDIKVRLKLENGTTYAETGRMEFHEYNVEQATGTFILRAQFPNPDRLLLPGMYVRAVIEAAIRENSYLVPQRAVTHNSKGDATALIVNQEGKVEERILVVRGSVGNNWIVDQGLDDGVQVIVEGNHLVRIGQDATAVEVVIDEATGEIQERKQGALPTPSKFAGNDEAPVPGSPTKD
ncbi:efflux RND transporter periplasmic adaptor subunit [Taklimakanibacter deserti]|uniref:efflux RND transporter periplasmic adaptor subunit n=1 Tax=Taklimakanibacter deserti TaxID=2267839 RepID=UPI0034D43B3D